MQHGHLIGMERTVCRSPGVAAKFSTLGLIPESCHQSSIEEAYTGTTFVPLHDHNINIKYGIHNARRTHLSV